MSDQTPTITVGETDGRVEQLTERVRKLEVENERLRERTSESFEDVVELLATEEVQATIDQLGADSTYAPEHTRAVVDLLAGSEWLTASQIEPYVDLAASSIREILRELDRARIVETRQDNREQEYRLSKDGLEARVRTERARQAVQDRREEETS